jgi:hypothetical protein
MKHRRRKLFATVNHLREVMPIRSIPERIHDFLHDRLGRAYCDDCVQERLGLKWRQQVQMITATLAVTTLFARALGICSTCGQEKQVTRATKPAQGQDAA